MKFPFQQLRSNVVKFFPEYLPKCSFSKLFLFQTVHLSHQTCGEGIIFTNLSQDFKICTANSLVGETINAANPSYSVILFRINDSITGIKNANVLPDPVRAVPIKSLTLQSYWDCFLLNVS